MSLADLTTEEIALFQMIEAGFIGVEHHVTCLRAEDTKTGEPCAVLAVYKRSIREGEFVIEPVARLLNDPSEVCNPVMDSTDGAGHERKEGANGGTDYKTPVAEGDQ